jgi:hypothetical protein
MENFNFTITEKYISDRLELTVGSENHPLDEKDLKKFTKLLLKNRNINKERLRNYHRAIEKFNINRKKFRALLSRSETQYRKLPIGKPNTQLETILDNKDNTLRKGLKKDRLRKLPEELSELTKFEKKVLEVRSRRTIEQKRAEIKIAVRQNKESVREFDAEQESIYIEKQWNIYQIFFNQNPVFCNVVSALLQNFIRETYSPKQEQFEEYSIKDDFIILVLQKDVIIKKLKEEEKRYKKELKAKIDSWERSSPSIQKLIQESDCKIKLEDFKIQLSFNIGQFYTKLLAILSQNDKIHYFFPFKFLKDYFINTNSYSLLFKKDLVKLLKSEFPRIDQKYESFILEKKINKKTYSKFNFRMFIQIQFKDFFKERTYFIASPDIHEKNKILQKLHLKVSIPGVIIIIFVILVFFGLNIPSVKVGNKDDIKLDYTVWESDENKDYDVLHPILDIVFWIAVVPITDNETTGIILGLYENLLGNQVQFKSGLIWLNRCIDQNRDGIDDNTGQPALTYGNSTDQYFNTCLMIQFKILDINKYSEPNPTEILNTRVITMIGTSIFWIIVVIMIILVGIFTVGVVRTKKKQLKVNRQVKWKKIRIYKYSILTIIMPALILTILYGINSITPFSQILLSNRYHPYVLPLLIGFVVGICIITLIIYPFLFEFLRGKYKKVKKIKKSSE